MLILVCVAFFSFVGSRFRLRFPEMWNLCYEFCNNECIYYDFCMHIITWMMDGVFVVILILVYGLVGSFIEFIGCLSVCVNGVGC